MKALQVKDLTTSKSLLSEEAICKPGNTYCGCLGTRHKPVTNCSSCGYIVCERVVALSAHVPQPLALEPLKKLPSSPYLQMGARVCMCPFCGDDCYLVPTAKSLETLGADPATVSAYAQKDRLLTFDREHAQRTVVRDAQGDYYSSSAWLTEEEKREIDEKELKRMQRLHAKKQRKYTIRFDIAGRKIVEAPSSSDDEADAAANAQSSHAAREATPSEPAYENVELATNHGDAGELYRLLKSSVGPIGSQGPRPAASSQRVQLDFS